MWRGSGWLPRRQRCPPHNACVHAMDAGRIPYPWLKITNIVELQASQCIPGYLVPYTYTRHHKYPPVPTALDTSFYKRTGFVFVSVHVPPAFRPTTTLQQYWGIFRKDLENCWLLKRSGMRLLQLKWPVPSFLPTESWRSSSQRTVTINSWHPTLQRPQGLLRYYHRNHH